MLSCCLAILLFLFCSLLLLLRKMLTILRRVIADQVSSHRNTTLSSLGVKMSCQSLSSSEHTGASHPPPNLTHSLRLVEVWPSEHVYTKLDLEETIGTGKNRHLNRRQKINCLPSRWSPLNTFNLLVFSLWLKVCISNNKQILFQFLR